MSEEFVVGLVASTTDFVSDTLTGALPLIILLFAALVGLAIGIKYFKKWIGRK